MRFCIPSSISLLLLTSLTLQAESTQEVNDETVISKTPVSSSGIESRSAVSSLAIPSTPHPEQNWGIGVVLRNVDVPYDTEESNITSFVPLFYYEGEHLFLRGLGGGAHLYQTDDWEFNAMARLRFFDVPAEVQSIVQGDTIDLGLNIRKIFSENKYLEMGLYSDLEGNPYADISQSWYFQNGSWDFQPQISARYKSADFNSRYYSLTALTDENIGAGIELKGGIDARYHVANNFYLLAGVHGTLLDENAYQSSTIDQRWQSELYLGFSFTNDKTKAKKSSLTNKGYLRVSQGWATPSNIGEIFAGGNEKDEFGNKMTSVFYGYPLTDSLFTANVDVYLTSGFVWHWNSDVQDSEQEYVMAMKAYYTFDWPVRLRLGAAEGLSYMSDVTYIEKAEMEEKGYRPSDLMNYLDLSIDINLGDIFNANALRDTWLGYGLHHRSAVFEKSSLYGSIKGGSNYNTVYVQFDF